MAYEMGDMPESEKDELALEGSEYESPEKESSSVDEILGKLGDLDKDALTELKQAVDDELAKLDEDEPDEEELPADEESDEDIGDLSSMFS